jgi:7-cyano-7-deazaguanosine (preQ0) biosynthesis protein QueE
MKVNEIYGPVEQGEGPALGEPCLFLRMAGCNLACTFCDSRYAWDWSMYDRTVEEHSFPVEEVTAKLRSLSNGGTRLVILSGGEPVMQAATLLDLMTAMHDFTFDVETAGTIYPGDSFMARLRNCVVSPKLVSSGNEGRRPIRLDVLQRLARWPKTSFKFVIGDEMDLEEVMDLLPFLPRKPWEGIYLMPLGATKEQLAQTGPLAERLARELNMSYSPRRHIELYGSRRGI